MDGKWIGQEMPPPAQQGAVPYTRNLPARGPTGAVLLAGVAGIVSFGFWAYFRGLRLRTELEREKLQARCHLAPYLTYESDVRTIGEVREQRRFERELLGEEPFAACTDDLQSPFYHNPAVMDRLRLPIDLIRAGTAPSPQ